MRRKHSAVTAIANHLVSYGYSRTNAFVKAWVLVKLDKISTKAVGVTFGNRQRALEHVARYSPERVTLHLVRDKRQGTWHTGNNAALYGAGLGEMGARQLQCV